MKTLIIALVCLAAATFGGHAQNIINPSNTVVRFAFLNNGTNYGQVDVELFDQDKPETVRNFLLYVYSGGYSNIFPHRLLPNFVLQGGRGKLPSNVAGSTTFDTYLPIPTYGRITNEYNVGPTNGNDFGTLVMAKVGGITDSAENEWFFNLANNPDLNTQNGGFTVFGHVVNSTGTRNGTNFLAYLNTFSRGHGVTNTVTESPLEVFSDLPVATDRTPTVFYRDLITVQVFVIQNSLPPDTLIPSVTVTTPSANIEVTNDTFRLSGTAADNKAVARVFYESDIFGRFVANGTTSWSGDIQILGGTNVITVRSVDSRGNLSLPVKRTIYRVLLQPLPLHIIGSGRILGATNGQLLRVGDIYKLTARPSAGYLFKNWDGNFFSTTPIIRFRMEENVTNITVVFAQPLARLAKGSYSGLFSPMTNGPKNSAGALKLNLSASGSYSGVLSPLGANYTIRGQFNAVGYSRITGPLGAKTLTVEMLIVTNGGYHIIGGYSDGTFFSSLELHPAQTFGPGGVPAPEGSHTFLLSPPLDGNSTAVKGFGSGTAVIDARGRVKMSGTLADGTPISQTTTLLRGLRWPFVSNARRGAGAIVGWATFENSGLAFDGEMKWFSPGFPGATNQNLTLAGSIYRPPTITPPLFPWTSGTITFSGLDLGTLTVNLTLAANGTFTIPVNPHNVQILLEAATGRISGSFSHPTTLLLTEFQGTVLQNDDKYAAGFYESTAGNGAFQIRGL